VRSRSRRRRSAKSETEHRVHRVPAAKASRRHRRVLVGRIPGESLWFRRRGWEIAFVARRPFFGHWLNLFWNDRKRLSLSGNNFRKYRPVNTVTLLWDIWTKCLNEKKPRLTEFHSARSLPWRLLRKARVFCSGFVPGVICEPMFYFQKNSFLANTSSEWKTCSLARGFQAMGSFLLATTFLICCFWIDMFPFKSVVESLLLSVQSNIRTSSHWI